MLAQTRTEQKALIGGLTSRQRAAVLLLNVIPLLHVAAVIATAILTPTAWWIRLMAALLVLYVVPPIAVRSLFAMGRIREGNLALGSRDFFIWWASFQWQVLFCRLPAFEEMMRLVPGLYSSWLRLWGSKIGRYTFWAPGTLILDRSFLRIGDDVVFGVGVRLNAHVGDVDDVGQRRLLLAAVEIGNRCHVGGYSLLTAGTIIEHDQTTKAFLLSPPFSTWRDGKRVRETAADHQSSPRKNENQ